MQLAERVFPVSEYLKRQFTAAFFYPFEFCLTGALKNLSFLRAVQRNFYQWTPEFGYPNGKRAVLPDLHRHMQGQIPLPALSEPRYSPRPLLRNPREDTWLPHLHWHDMGYVPPEYSLRSLRRPVLLFGSVCRHNNPLRDLLFFCYSRILL